MDRLVSELEATIHAEGADTIAAFFAEPVMGTGGVVVAPDGYFSKVQEVLRRHDILLVADEVICGFGRTGAMWGSQTVGMQPDMVTCAKGLSASYLPISALLLNEKIYQVMRSQSDKIGIFGHGYTYGGHPVPSAVALEAIKIYEERQLPAHAKRMGERLMKGLQGLSSHALVGEVRGKGLMAAVEMVADKETRSPFDPARKAGMLVGKAAESQGLVVRPLGDTICIAPPLIVTEDEIDMIVRTLGIALDDAANHLTV